MIPRFDDWLPERHSDFLRAGSGQGLLVCPEGCVPPGRDTKAPAEPQGMTCQQQVTPGPCLPLGTDGHGSPGNGGFDQTCRKSPFVTHWKLFWSCALQWQPLSKFLSAFLRKTNHLNCGSVKGAGWAEGSGINPGMLWARRDLKDHLKLLQRTPELWRVRCKRHLLRKGRQSFSVKEQNINAVQI